jgi:hypothetical protein
LPGKLIDFHLKINKNGNLDKISYFWPIVFPQLEIKTENPLISAKSALLAFFYSIFSARSAFSSFLADFRSLILIGLSNELEV